MKPSEAKESLALLWFMLGCAMSTANSTWMPGLLSIGAVFCTFVGGAYVWESWKYARVERAITQAVLEARDEAVKQAGKK